MLFKHYEKWQKLHYIDEDSMLMWLFGDQWLLRKKNEIIIKIKINPNHWSVQYSIQNHLIFKSHLLLHIQINCHMHIPWSLTRWDRSCSDVLEEEVVKLGFWESWRLVGLFWVFPITWERAETIADMSCWDLAENTGNDKWSSPSFSFDTSDERGLFPCFRSTFDRLVNSFKQPFLLARTCN